MWGEEKIVPVLIDKATYQEDVWESGSTVSY